MNACQGRIISMWLNNDGKSIGMAVVVKSNPGYCVHQVSADVSAKGMYSLGDDVLIDTISNKLIYQ